MTILVTHPAPYPCVAAHEKRSLSGWRVCPSTGCVFALTWSEFPPLFDCCWIVVEQDKKKHPLSRSSRQKLRYTQLMSPQTLGVTNSRRTGHSVFGAFFPDRPQSRRHLHHEGETTRPGLLPSGSAARSLMEEKHVRCCCFRRTSDRSFVRSFVRHPSG